MKIICSKTNLLNGINTVQKAVSIKTTLPILECILLEAGETFKLTANDLEIGIECIIESDIKEKGSIVLNSRIFGEIVRKLSDSEILIQVKSNNVVIIECENSHFEVKGLAAEGFPAIPEIAKENAFSISQKLMRDMIKQTIFAVGIDENRPVLMGSLIEAKDGQITFVSIDGFRMALRTSDISNKKSSFKAIVPGKTLNEISKILQPVDEEVVIYISNNQILFDVGQCKVTSRLLEGEYLNYKGIIPREHETKVTINTKDLLASVERASLMSMDEKKVPVKFNISDEILVLSSSTDVGTVREEIRIYMEGKVLEIGFNPRYIIDALKVIEEEKVNMFFSSNVGPCIFCPTEGEGYTYMVLPVRARNE